MVEKVLGEKTEYLLVQKHKETAEELALNYNSYNGMFNPNYDVNYASRWADVETVNKLAATQNLIAGLMGQKWEYLVVKEDVIRADNAEVVVEETPPVEEPVQA